MSKIPPYFFNSEQVRQNALRCMMSLPIGEDWVAEFRKNTRNDEHSKKFHAMCADVSMQLTYVGKKISPAAWKVLFISGHAIATGEGAEIVPGLEGEFCNIRESSAKMSIKRFASLIEYVTAYCAENGVVFSDPIE